MTAARERKESTDPVEAHERIEATPRKLPTEATDRADPIERMDPADPMERIDPAELIDRIEFVESIDQSERPFEAPVAAPAGRCSVMPVTVS